MTELEGGEKEKKEVVKVLQELRKECTKKLNVRHTCMCLLRGWDWREERN